MTKDTDDILERLIKLGMREYNAKIVIALYTIGIAKAGDLHKLTGVPRGRVYDALNDLIDLGVVVKTNTVPAYYYTVDAEQAYYSIHKKYLDKIMEIRDCVEELQTIHSPSHKSIKTFNEYHTADAINLQVKMRMHRAKQDVMIICNDQDTLKEYSYIIKQTANKIPVYLVLNNKDMIDIAPIKAYTTTNTLQCELMQVLDKTYDEVLPYSMYFYFDRSSSMGIIKTNNGDVFASSIEVDIYADFVVKNFLHSIESIKK